MKLFSNADTLIALWRWGCNSPIMGNWWASPPTP